METNKPSEMAAQENKDRGYAYFYIFLFNNLSFYELSYADHNAWRE